MAGRKRRRNSRAFSSYDEAFVHAVYSADRMKRPMELHKKREFGRTVYVVRMISRADPVRGQTVRPGEPLTAAQKAIPTPTYLDPIRKNKQRRNSSRPVNDAEARQLLQYARRQKRAPLYALGGRKKLALKWGQRVFYKGKRYAIVDYDADSRMPDGVSLVLLGAQRSNQVLLTGVSTQDVMGHSPEHSSYRGNRRNSWHREATSADIQAAFDRVAPKGSTTTGLGFSRAAGYRKWETKVEAKLRSSGKITPAARKLTPRERMAIRSVVSSGVRTEEAYLPEHGSFGVRATRKNPRTRFKIGQHVYVPQAGYNGRIVRFHRQARGARPSLVVRFGSGREVAYSPEEVQPPSWERNNRSRRGRR